MNPQRLAALQDAVFRRTACDPEWIGHWLARHRDHERLAPDALAQRLGVDRDGLAKLCLCRTPREDQFAADLDVVCRRTGASTEALASILKRERTLAKWAGEPAAGGAAGWLAAASERPTGNLDEASGDDQLD